MKTVVLSFALLFSSASIVLGQGCSICTKSVAGLDNKQAKGLNGGIIYLGLIPLTIIGTIGWVWWKGNKQVEN